MTLLARVQADGRSGGYLSPNVSKGSAYCSKAGLLIQIQPMNAI